MPLPSWKKVLVIDLGFLGDTVHSIPAIRALAQAGAEVDVLTTNVGQDLLRMVPDVNRAWVVPLRKPSPPPWRHLETLRDIRAQKYDGAISFVGSDRNLFVQAGVAPEIASPISRVETLGLREVGSPRRSPKGIELIPCIYKDSLSFRSWVGWGATQAGRGRFHWMITRGPRVKSPPQLSIFRSAPPVHP